MSFLFKNLSLLDPNWKEARGGYEVLVEGDTIKEVSSKPIKSKAATVVDCGKRTLTPGLIDCHVHTHHSEVYINRMEAVPLTLMMARSAGRLKRMLDRGFTTVRDAGGADWGTKTAVESGLIPGPRMFISCRSIGPTGGHNDRNRRTDFTGPPCLCCNGMVFIRCIADGPDAVRKAAREQMRQGADQVKLMVSGGVASPTDRITNTQFAAEEIRAAVEEAVAADVYVTAHAYTPRAVARAVECGVRGIEHGNLLDEATVGLMRDRGTFLIPTLSVVHAVIREGVEAGFPAELREKMFTIFETGTRVVEMAHRLGVKLVYGTDLLGAMHRHQLDEFALRGEVLKPLEVIRSATVTAAELFRREGEIGVVAPEARADLLVVEGNPLDDLGTLRDPERHLTVIVKGGVIRKNVLP